MLNAGLIKFIKVGKHLAKIFVQSQTQKPYNEKGVLRVSHWANILPQEASHPLHNNNQANLPVYGCGAGQLILLPPIIVQKKRRE